MRPIYSMKTIVITGGTSGIGEVVVKTLLDAGWEVYMLARNEKKAIALQKRPKGENLHFYACDVSDLTQVQMVSKQLLNRIDHLDVLMNNAGAIIQSRELSAQGHEMSFALNHLGHFLLTQSLLSSLIKSKTRVINVSSEAHRAAEINFDDLNWKKRKYSAIKTYGFGKLCNIYCAQQLHERYNNEGLTAFSLHPGVVNTNFAGNTSGVFKFMKNIMSPFMITPEQGAQTQMHLATAPYIEKHSGRYFDKRRPKHPAPIGLDKKAAKKLWEISEELVKDFY